MKGNCGRIFFSRRLRNWNIIKILKYYCKRIIFSGTIFGGKSSFQQVRVDLI